MTTPNCAHTNELLRTENRYNRAIPTLVCPWEKKGPVEDECVVALTKDIADRGVGLLMDHQLAANEVAIGFWLPDPSMEEPWFFLGTQKRTSEIGGGFWTIGIEIWELLNPNFRTELQPLISRAEKLLPPSCPELPKQGHTPETA